ncbi:MAG TPA: YwiC-like family protein [Pyrinomonadaceae bacterium]
MSTIASERKRALNLKTIALPTEHGGWGLVLEPLLVGLLLAPSFGGVFLSLATLAAFLARQPLKIFATEVRRKQLSARTSVARNFAYTYILVSILAFVPAVIYSPRLFLLPLFIALPLVVIQILFDMAGRSRDLIPELSGAAAMAAVSAAIILAGGGKTSTAFLVWVILVIVRVVPSILYVRARLRMNRSARNSQLEPPSIILPIAAHLFACLVMAGLAYKHIVPILLIGTAVILTLRAALFLSPLFHRITAVQVGFSEIGFGLITIISLVIAYQSV